MKSVGVSASRRWRHQLMIAALAASPLILFWHECAFAQTTDKTEASKTWEAAAAAAAAPASSTPEVKPAASIPTNLVPDDSASPPPLPLPPPPRDTAIEDDDVIPPPRDTSAPIENDPTTLPNNIVSTPIDDGTQSTSTVEIPPAIPAPDPAVADSPPPPINVEPAPEAKPAADSVQTPAEEAEIARYQQEQSGPSGAQQYRNLQTLATEGDITTPIGLQLREERRSLKGGEEADGLLIVSVRKGSPAATAGLHGFSHAVHDVITGAAMIGSLWAGPAAMLVVPLVEYMQVGESYDLIIGIDGSRVKNFLDFDDQMRDVQPGELVYFSIVRDGKRLQVAVPITTALN